MEEYHVENHRISVGYSRDTEVTKGIIENILDYEKIMEAVKKNNVVYCYNIDKYKETKGLKDLNTVMKGKHIIGITDRGIVITFENLEVDKEAVFKISRLKNK